MGIPSPPAYLNRRCEGRIKLRRLNLDGDAQADLEVHGGKDKAVYCYQSLHYEFWKRELPGRDLPFGMFGENFTLDGLLEDSIHVGDRFAVGSAEVVVTQPRMPCYKLGFKFQSDEMVRRFLASRRTGFYLAVLREGEVGVDDEMNLLARDESAVPVSEITRLYVTKRYDKKDLASIKRLQDIPALPGSWKRYFLERAGPRSS